VEGQDDRRAASSVRTGNQLADQVLVAAVNAVEDPDRQPGVMQGKFQEGVMMDHG